MSAGICIMNKNAAVMAADSAVTLGNRSAIHNSADKLFRLSEAAPLGLLTYGSGTVMGVPIEIIVNEYKTNLGSQKYPRFDQYVDDFINFVENDSEYFKFENYELSYLCEFYIKTIKSIKRRFEDLIFKSGKNADQLGQEAITNAFELTFSEFFDLWNKSDSIAEYDFSEYARNKYGETLLSIIKQDKDLYFLSDSQKETLCDKTFELLEKNCQLHVTGISITGYGEKEIYPSNCHLTFDGVIGGRLRCFSKDKIEISDEHQSEILTYAQRDIIHRIIYGMDQNERKIFYSLPNIMKGKFEKLDPNLFASGKKDEVCNYICGELIKAVASASEMQRRITDLNPSIIFLPVKEMACLADSMINITSILSQVKTDQNYNATVGGPVDVCAISKIDGFTWVRRKNQFDI